MNSEYTKALSVRNVADMVYAQQVFHQPGMPPGLYLCRLYGNIEIIKNAGWIVWFDRINPFYETMTDEEFRERFVIYDQLPKGKKTICDANPDYEEFINRKNNHKTKEVLR